MATAVKERPTAAERVQISRWIKALQNGATAEQVWAAIEVYVLTPDPRRKSA